MPVLNSKYKAPFYLVGGDMQTIVPALFRIVIGVDFHRERIETPDCDFLDVDWVWNDSKKIALLIHGLEASAHQPYMRGMAKALNRAGYKVAAMNLRGCSGDTNLQARAYHSGSTDDVETVISHILHFYECEELVLVGFSLGGNLIIKYLGERGNDIPEKISSAVTISVPCDLNAGAFKLDQRLPFIYRDRFLKTLKKKLLERQGRFPFDLPEKKIRSIHTLVEFDELYTSKMYGFNDALHYYTECSGKKFISAIAVPTLILTARNDPFFTSSCFPFNECSNHANVYLEVSNEGGHVGFCIDLFKGRYYSEERAIAFLRGRVNC